MVSLCTYAGVEEFTCGRFVHGTLGSRQVPVVVLGFRLLSQDVTRINPFYTSIEPFE